MAVKGDGVARITINRPPLNILNVETVLEITSALKTAKEDESVSIVLITGAGDRAFSAGAEVRDHMPDRVDRFLGAFNEMFYTLMEIDKPRANTSPKISFCFPKQTFLTSAGTQISASTSLRRKGP